MGFMDRVKAALGIAPAHRLVEFPDEVRQVDVDTVHVHTANLSPDTDEKLVIVTMPASALSHIALIDGPTQLTHPTERPVTWVPVDHDADPLLDPNLGWIIPLTAATAVELRALPEGPGEHELSSLHLGLILE